MSDQPQDNAQDNDPPLLFSLETMDEAQEFLRLTLRLLTKHDLPPNPVNYGLGYNYAAGRDTRLREKLDEIFEKGKGLDREEAQKLFLRFIYSCDEAALEGVREELLRIVAELVGALIEMAGKASVSSENLDRHVDRLEQTNDVKEVLSIASSIASETRSLAADSRDLGGHLQLSSEEMTKLKEELERARHAAYIDALTGILNRRGFDQELAHLIEQADEQTPQFSLLIMDIDHFKSVNDKYGHLAGDKVLQALAHLLNTHTKGGDRSARFGGEEFAVLLPETRIGSALKVAENIRLHVEKLVLKRPRTGELLSDVTVSIGAGSFRLGETADEFVHRCDKALYQAKKLGRNRVIQAD
jgi:diguanylate cyclase